MCTAESLSWRLSYHSPLEVLGDGYKAKGILFRDHFIINAARGLAAKH